MPRTKSEETKPRLTVVDAVPDKERENGLFRGVSIRMWDDAWFRSLPGEAKLLWNYLLSNPHTIPIPGLFRVGEAAMAEECAEDLFGPGGTSRFTIRQLMQRFSDDGKLEQDREARVVWLKNAVSHVTYTLNPNVVTSWRAYWKHLPECDLKVRALQSIRDELLASGKGWADAAFKAAFPELLVTPERRGSMQLASVVAARTVSLPETLPETVVGTVPPNRRSEMRDERSEELNPPPPTPPQLPTEKPSSSAKGRGRGKNLPDVTGFTRPGSDLLSRETERAKQRQLIEARAQGGFYDLYSPAVPQSVPGNGIDNPLGNSSPKGSGSQASEGEARRIWREVTVDLQRDGKRYALEWLAAVEPRGVTEEVLVLAVGRESLFAEWLGANYACLVNDALGKIAPRLSVKFEFCEALAHAQREAGRRRDEPPRPKTRQEVLDGFNRLRVDFGLGSMLVNLQESAAFFEAVEAAGAMGAILGAYERFLREDGREGRSDFGSRNNFSTKVFLRPKVWPQRL